MTDLTFDVWGHTDVGQARNHNEDSLYFVNEYEPSVPTEQLAENGLLMAIADGVGGVVGGERASRSLLDHLVRQFYLPRELSVPQHLLTAIDEANSAAHVEVNMPGASTTLVSAVIHHEKLHVAHVGDSRAYLVRDRTLHQITEDHAFGNRLLRYMVSTEMVEADLHAPIPLQANDKLLLCSDGLYRELHKPREVLDILASHSAEEAAYQLVDLANARGGHDNITVIVVQVRRQRRIPKIYPSRWESI